MLDTGDRLLTPGEVAAVFRVDPKTVTRWAACGRIGSIRTPTGHRRYRESEVRALLEGDGIIDQEGDGTDQRRSADSLMPPAPTPRSTTVASRPVPAPRDSRSW